MTSLAEKQPFFINGSNSVFWDRFQYQSPKDLFLHWSKLLHSHLRRWWDHLLFLRVNRACQGLFPSAGFAAALGSVTAPSYTMLNQTTLSWRKEKKKRKLTTKQRSSSVWFKGRGGREPGGTGTNFGEKITNFKSWGLSSILKRQFGKEISKNKQKVPRFLYHTWSRIC